MYTLKGCTALFLVTCVQKISFSCVFFPPKDKRIFCYQNLLTKVDPFNVTFRIHTLLDMTSDERQNQANEVKVWCSRRYSTRTEYEISCVNLPRGEGACDRAAAEQLFFF